MKNVKFHDAIQIFENLKITFDRTYKELNLNISKHALHALIWFNRKYDGNATIKHVKNDICDKYKKINKQKLEVKMSKMISLLEVAGFISRKKDLEDKRTILIVITTKGHHQLKTFFKQASKIWKEINNE